MSIAIIAAPSNAAASASTVDVSINFVKLSIELGEATTLAGLMNMMERSFDNDLVLQMPIQDTVLVLRRDAGAEDYTELVLGGVVKAMLTDEQLRDAVQVIESFIAEVPVAA